MSDPFDLLLKSSAEDGASASTGLFLERQPPEDVDDLYKAWTLERDANLKRDVLLDETRILLARLVKSEQLTRRAARRIRDLYRSIQEMREDEQSS